MGTFSYNRRTRKAEKNPNKFGYKYSDPEAKQADDGHYYSRNPNTGEILKGRRHPTIKQTKKGEKEMGYKIVRSGGRLYSFPKKSKQ